MAKSKFIAARRSKKSTVVVSKRTLEEAIARANMLVENLMEGDQNDPEIAKVEQAVQHMTQVLKADPQQMRQDGASSISDYMDDAKMPEQARRLKSEVDMILKMHKAYRDRQQVQNVPDSAVYQHGADQYPSGATESGQYQFDPNMKNNLRPIAEPVHASKKNADGGAAFSTDRDEKGEAKAPEKLEVPRVAKKKKEAVPEPAAPVPAAVPAPEAAAPAPAAGGANPIDYIPTETLIKVIGDLPKEDDFAQNKGKQDAVVQLTEILKSRPVLPPEQEAAAPAPAASTAPALSEPAPAAPVPPVAASAKKADLGDHAVSDDGSIGGGSSPSRSISPSSKPSGSIAPRNEATPSPEKATVGFGGLNLSSSEKTADDYRIQDYKLTEEGVRPTGGKPSMEEQEEHGVPGSVDFPNEMHETPTPMHASVKVGVTPPGISEKLMHKLKSEYPGEPDKAYATAWSIHNQKESSLKVITAEIEKIAAGYGGGWYTSYKPMEVDEDGGRTPEIGEAHSKLEDNTGIKHPETTMPIKLNDQQSLKTGAKVAAEMTTGKAVKESETIGNDLKKMYLDAKSLTQVNDTRAVREAVEAIFRAADMFDEATKALNKQHQQEESEAAAAEIKAKNKKSSLGGLAVAAGE
jgi:hypothetical protein